MIKMNKYKKRIIEQWKTLGHFAMTYIFYYKHGSGSAPLHYIGDLKSAYSYYIRYLDVYVLLNEHNI